MTHASESASTVTVRQLDIQGEDPASALPSLNEIHVWQRRTQITPKELSRLRAHLSKDEWERAHAFRFESDRNEYFVSRGTLRTLLGAYLVAPPAELRFQYSDFGRPALAGVYEEGKLNFNVSHSGGITLWAFAMNRQIGIDVEKIRHDFSILEIAERFFSESERKALKDLPEQEQHDAFFRCWTRKEAFIKALGEGLSHPLDQFDVSLSPGVPPQLLATRPCGAESQHWAIWDIAVPAGYAAALVAEL